jgi:hypothetical protein
MPSHAKWEEQNTDPAALFADAPTSADLRARRPALRNRRILVRILVVRRVAPLLKETKQCCTAKSEHMNMKEISLQRHEGSRGGQVRSASSTDKRTALKNEIYGACLAAVLEHSIVARAGRWRATSAELLLGDNWRLWSL